MEVIIIIMTKVAFYETISFYALSRIRPDLSTHNTLKTGPDEHTHTRSHIVAQYNVSTQL